LSSKRALLLVGTAAVVLASSLVAVRAVVPRNRSTPEDRRSCREAFDEFSTIRNAIEEKGLRPDPTPKPGWELINVGFILDAGPWRFVDDGTGTPEGTRKEGVLDPSEDYANIVSR
jgi:hypothetical protein